VSPPATAADLIHAIARMPQEERRRFMDAVIESWTQSALSRGTLEQELGAALKAAGVGLLLIEAGSVVRWICASRQEADGARDMLEVVTARVEAAINELTAKMDLHKHVRVTPPAPWSGRHGGST
jgi:hypothetical protein